MSFSESALHPETLNFEGVDAVGQIVCVRGVTIDSYEFDYESNIFVINGEFGKFSSRIVFVLEITRKAVCDFFEHEIPFIIHPVHSMIPVRMRKKRATSYFPILTCDFPAVKTVLALYQKYQRLVRLYSSDPSAFKDSNFFEYVVKCRMEHRLQLSNL